MGAILVFSAVPLINQLLGLSTKDYDLWYQVGVAVRQGLDIYPRPESRPALPVHVSPLRRRDARAAQHAGLDRLVVSAGAGELGVVGGLDRAVDPLGGQLPALGGIRCLRSFRRSPSSCLIYNVYLLGQPNLLLLALLLGAFACLRLGWQIGAGALVATAAAIKAFPIMVLGYLVYRRMWTASVATVAVLAAWLLVAPLPFRTPAQAVDDLVVWSRGMVFTYNTYGIAQRPFRSYSYKNQSIMGLAHRLLRDVPADGESVLSKKTRAGQPGARPAKGLPPVDPSTDLLTFLKPHRSPPRQTASTDCGSRRATRSLGRCPSGLRTRDSATPGGSTSSTSTFAPSRPSPWRPS